MPVLKAWLAEVKMTLRTFCSPNVQLFCWRLTVWAWSVAVSNPMEKGLGGFGRYWDTKSLCIWSNRAQGSPVSLYCQRLTVGLELERKMGVLTIVFLLIHCQLSYNSKHFYKSWQYFTHLFKVFNVLFALLTISSHFGHEMLVWWDQLAPLSANL